MARQFSFEAGFAELSPAARRRALDETMRARPDSDCVWLFGYGSLMWDEPAPVAERRRARLEGWHRALVVWSALARGTPERPGLCLGLERGGAAEGVALRVEGPDLAGRLAPVWARELWTDIYRPEWVRLESAEGPLDAVAFVVDPASLQYAGGLSAAEAARHIARAAGEKGSCRDYLARALAELAALGIEEPALAAMLALVDAETSGR